MANENLAGSARRILAADDSNQDSLLLKEAFDVCSIPVVFECVADGDELRAKLEVGVDAFDLVLLDNNLPRRTALEVLSDERGLQLVRTVAVVVLSGFVAADDKLRLLELGARAVFAKPVDLDGYVSLAKDLNSLMPARD